jgi:hypothetical protein
MKNQKQNKVSPRAHDTFILAAQSAALEAAQRVARKLGAGRPGVVANDLEYVAQHAVSVYQRTEKLEKRTWAENKVQVVQYLVLDVLINPAMLPVAQRAQEAHDKLVPLIESAKARAPHVYLAYWDGLVELVNDCKAISCVFRAWVQIGDDGLAVDGGTFTACSYRRSDKVGKLNAARYGSLAGVEKLLVRPLHEFPPSKKDYTGQVEKWAGNSACSWDNRLGHDDVNVERIVADAVDQSESYGCLSDEQIQYLAGKLTPELIEDDVQEHLLDVALRERLFGLVADIKALGLTVIKGPTQPGPGYDKTCTVAVTASSVQDDDRPGFLALRQAEASLVALHKALVK